LKLKSLSVIVCAIQGMLLLVRNGICQTLTNRVNSHDRRKRRQKRSRGGVNMPDREPKMTHRTGRASAPQPELSDEQYFGETSDQATPNQTMSMRPSTLQRKSAQQARASIAADAAMNNNSPGYSSSRHPDHLSVALGMGNRLMLSGNRSFNRPYWKLKPVATLKLSVMALLPSPLFFINVHPICIKFFHAALSTDKCIVSRVYWWICKCDCGIWASLGRKKRRRSVQSEAYKDEWSESRKWKEQNQ
jgi:hypothetical protein